MINKSLKDLYLIWANEMVCSYKNGKDMYMIFSLKRKYTRSH